LLTVVDANVVHFCPISAIAPAPAALLATAVDVTLAVVVGSLSPAPDKKLLLPQLPLLFRCHCCCCCYLYCNHSYQLFTVADAIVVHLCQISVISPATNAVLGAAVDANIEDSVVVASISPASDKEASSVEVIAALIAATVVLLSPLLLLPPQ
jgi:hypothetical protein